jgi:hypothetical protein
MYDTNLPIVRTRFDELVDARRTRRNRRRPTAITRWREGTPRIDN